MPSATRPPGVSSPPRPHTSRRGSTRSSESTPLLTEARDEERYGVSSSRNADTNSPSAYLNDLSPSRFWVIFIQVLLSQFIFYFDGTITSSSHPVITSHFKAANSASWLSTSFLLTSSAFQPIVGRLSDALGRKVLFVWCLLIFTGGTIWCSLAQSIESVIAARAVCGIGGGGTMALGMIIISDIVPIE